MKIRPDPTAQKKAKLRKKRVAKRQPFGRVFLRDYDEDTDKVTYLHTTRGRVTRVMTPELFRALVG